MDPRIYRRRATGEMAIEPALHELVMSSGRLLDRLICACPSPIPSPEERAAKHPGERQPAAGDGRGDGDGGDVDGGGEGGGCNGGGCDAGGKAA